MRWLLDEMLPPTATTELGLLGHEAWSARAAGLTGRPDDEVLEWAVGRTCALVTENVADFAIVADDRQQRGQPGVPIIFVRRSDLPRGGAMGRHLALRLDRWAADNPDPWRGPHWLPSSRPRP